MSKLAHTPTVSVDVQIAQLEKLLAIRRLTIADRRQAAPDPRRELGRRMADRGIR
jgi:hypothetical protein